MIGRSEIMKKYSKPVISVTVISNESVVTLSGKGTLSMTSTTNKKTRATLGLNS